MKYRSHFDLSEKVSRSYCIGTSYCNYSMKMKQYKVVVYQVLVIWYHIHLKGNFWGSHITSLWFVLVILFLPGEVASVTIPTNTRWITLLIETFLYHWKHRHREQMQEHTHAPPFPKSEVCRPDWKNVTLLDYLCSTISREDFLVL